MRLLLLSGTLTKITTRPDRMTTMNISCGDNVKGPNADSVRWRKSELEPTSATGAVASQIVGGAVPKVKGHTRQVRGTTIECDGLLSNVSFCRSLRRS